MRRNKRDVLAKRLKRQNTEEHQRSVRADEERYTENRAQDPPRADAAIEIVRLCGPTGDGRDREQSDDTAGGPEQRRIRKRACITMV